jgi:hypothetical protein
MIFSTVLFVPLLLAVFVLHAADPSTPPSHSGIHACDRGGEDQQITSPNRSQSNTNVALADTLRRAVMAHDGLSVDGQRIVIISVNNAITLLGPVQSEAERDAIETTVRSAAGTASVDNRLELR